MHAVFFVVFLQSYFDAVLGERKLWLTLSKSEVAVCPGNRQASGCQAERGRDDSLKANPLK